MLRVLQDFLLYATSITIIVNLAILSITAMGWFTTKNHLPVDGKTVLLTGASQGMGLSVAHQLASKGAHIIIVARDEAKLSSALTSLRDFAKSPSQRFHAISADVTSESENVRILKEATEWNGGFPPDVVWAIAGSSNPTLLLEASSETLRAQMEVNYWAAVYLVRETMKTWLEPSSLRPSSKAGHGEPDPRHIIVTSSAVAFMTIVGYSPYSPAKAALRTFADTMRSELNLYNGSRRRTPSSTASSTSLGSTAGSATSSPSTAPPPTDIQIHLITPGTIDSPGYALENKLKHPITLELEASDPVQTPDFVASTAIKGLEAGKYLITIGWFGTVLSACGWMGAPRANYWLDALFASICAWIVPIICWDLERTVWGYGKKWGIGRKPVEETKGA